MIQVIQHGDEYNKRKQEQEVHTYQCGYYRSSGKRFGGCGCVFHATLADLTYMVVGHGMMDYVGRCPECSASIHDMINRVD